MADAVPEYELPDKPYGGNGPLLMGVTWSMTIIALVLMGLRTYTNIAVVKQFSWDYFWAAVTLVNPPTPLRAPPRSKSALMGEGRSRL